MRHVVKMHSKHAFQYGARRQEYVFPLQSFNRSPLRKPRLQRVDRAHVHAPALENEGTVQACLDWTIYVVSAL